MTRIRPDESELVGVSVREGHDATSARIHALIQEHLQRLGDADGGWSVLFRDPEDGRLWELTYPESELHGGGPINPPPPAPTKP